MEGKSIPTVAVSFALLLGVSAAVTKRSYNLSWERPWIVKIDHNPAP